MICVWFSYLEWKKKYPGLEEQIDSIWREGSRFGVDTVVFQEELRGINAGMLEIFECLDFVVSPRYDRISTADGRDKRKIA